MIEIKSLSFAYPDGGMLFNQMDLKLARGGVYGLLGKNGAGKSTLLKLIAGLVFPIEGECLVDQKEAKDRRPSVLQEICFLPEDLYVPELTAEQYVKAYADFYPRFDKMLLERCMTEFELPHTKELSQYSHGEKKKFFISFGLATHCRLFILDEPTNGLDIPSKMVFRKLLASAITEEKLFIISTHQVRDVERLIDSVLILHEGKIILNEKVDEQEKYSDLESLFNTAIAG